MFTLTVDKLNFLLIFYSVLSSELFSFDTWYVGMYMLERSVMSSTWHPKRNTKRGWVQLHFR